MNKSEETEYEILRRVSTLTKNPSFALQQLACNPYPTKEVVQDWIKDNTVELGVKLIEALPKDQSNPNFLKYLIQKSSAMLGESFIKQNGLWITSGINPSTGNYEAFLKGILIKAGP